MTLMQDRALCRYDMVSDFLESFTDRDCDDPRFIKAVNQILQTIDDLELEIDPEG